MMGLWVHEIEGGGGDLDSQRLIRTFTGPIGTNSSAPHSHKGRAEIVPKRLLAQLVPFGPPKAKRLFRFP